MPLVAQLSDLLTYALQLVTRRMIRTSVGASYGEKPLFSLAVLAFICSAVCIVGYASRRACTTMHTALPEDACFARGVVARWCALAELALQFGDAMVDTGPLAVVSDCKCCTQHYHKDAAELGELCRVVLHRNSWASSRALAQSGARPVTVGRQ